MARCRHTCFEFAVHKNSRSSEKPGKELGKYGALRMQDMILLHLALLL